MCMEIVWSFLALHEIIHIVHGHVGYLYAARGTPIYLQPISISSKSIAANDLDYQAVELWADNKAIAIVLRGLLLKSDDERLQAIFPEPDHKVFLWTFAVFTLFRILGISVDPSNLKGHSHPPTAAQFQMAITGAYTEIAQSFPTKINSGMPYTKPK